MALADCRATSVTGSPTIEMISESHFLQPRPSPGGIRLSVTPCGSNGIAPTSEKDPDAWHTEKTDTWHAADPC